MIQVNVNMKKKIKTLILRRQDKNNIEESLIFNFHYKERKKKEKNKST